MGVVKHYGKQTFGDAAVLQVGTVTVFAYNGNPATHVNALAKGDLCIDFSTPQIYQATAAGNNWSVYASAPVVLATLFAALSAALSMPHDFVYASGKGPVVVDTVTTTKYRLTVASGVVVPVTDASPT